MGQVRAEPRDTGIVVTWGRPSRNEDGTPLTDLVEFRLYRATGPATPGGAGERPAFSLLAQIRATEPVNATVRGGTYAFLDDGGGRGLSPGVRYTYRLQAVNGRGETGPPSVEAGVDFLPAPQAPTGLAATEGDGVVELQWAAAPVPASPGGSAVRGYNVYRGSQRGAYAVHPINPRPLLETRFRDAAVENESTYYYAVRSVATERPPWRESRDSNEVAATPRDLTPPAPPRGLVAVPGQGVVGLSWEANVERDLLGYLVYRREPPALTPARLVESPLQATTFTDRAVQRGRSYLYTITAVDRAPRRNESAPSSEVAVSLP